jgi:hypothetical protein
MQERVVLRVVGAQEGHVAGDAAAMDHPGIMPERHAGGVLAKLDEELGNAHAERGGIHQTSRFVA